MYACAIDSVGLPISLREDVLKNFTHYSGKNDVPVNYSRIRQESVDSGWTKQAVCYMYLQSLQFSLKKISNHFSPLSSSSTPPPASPADSLRQSRHFLCTYIHIYIQTPLLPNFIFFPFFSSQGAGELARRPVLLAGRRRVPIPVQKVPGADQLHADQPLPPLAEGRISPSVPLVSRGYGAWGRRGEPCGGVVGVPAGCNNVITGGGGCAVGVWCETCLDRGTMFYSLSLSLFFPLYLPLSFFLFLSVPCHLGD